jgi:hypothetical protein
LVSALGNAVNRGMALASGRDHLENAGTSPVLVEPIAGQLRLTGLVAKGRVQVFALGSSGERDHALAAEESAGSLGLALSAEHHCMHYEIVRE